MKIHFRFPFLPGVLSAALLWGAFSSSAQTTNVTVDPNAPWQGYLNASNIADTVYEGGPVPSPANLRAYFVPAVPTFLLFQPNTNTYDATAPGAFDNGVVNTFDSPGGTPLLQLQTVFYVDRGAAFDGETVTFSGTVATNSLPTNWTAYAFVEEWYPSYANRYSDTTVPLVAGQPFTVSSPNPILSGDLCQYGFYMFGPNTAPNSPNSQQVVSVLVASNQVPTANVTVDPTQDWVAYLTYDNTNGGYLGSYATGLGGLPSTFIPNQADALRLILGINTNTWDAGGADVFDNANGTPATSLILDTYVDATNDYAGQLLVFSGRIESNSLPAGWTATAIIKEWTPGYGAEVAAPTVPLVGGQSFALSHAFIASNNIAQYGFEIIGPNTAPNSPASMQAVSVFAGSTVTITASLSGGNIQISFPTVEGTGYTVQYKNHLTDASWSTLTTIVGDGGVDSATDPIGGKGSTRFYRVSMN